MQVLDQAGNLRSTGMQSQETHEYPWGKGFQNKGNWGQKTTITITHLNVRAITCITYVAGTWQIIISGFRTNRTWVHTYAPIYQQLHHENFTCPNQKSSKPIIFLLYLTHILSDFISIIIH